MTQRVGYASVPISHKLLDKRRQAYACFFLNFECLHHDAMSGVLRKRNSNVGLYYKQQYSFLKTRNWN